MSEQIQTTERADEARAFAEKLATPELKRLASLYFNQRKHTYKGRTVWETTVRARELAAFFCELNPGTREDRERVRKLLPGCYLTSESFDGESSFAGMPNAELIREFKGETSRLQASFERARQEVARTGLKEVLEESSRAVRRKRKRALSEHDGDWELERKWDSSPFSTTVMGKKEFAFVEICFPMTMLGSASQEDLNEFCSRCLALAEVLETAGYRIAITGESWHRQGTAGGYRNELVRYLIREPDEYGDIRSVATYASCEFFRRTMFLLSRGSSHVAHGLADRSDSVGGTVDQRWIPGTPGQLILDHATVAKLFQLHGDQATEFFKARMLHTKKVENLSEGWAAGA